MKQEKQCRYNVTLRRVRATIVAVVKQWVLHDLSVCVCSLMYTACNAHAPYRHLGLAPLYNIFPHYLINGKIFGGKKKLLNKQCVFWFSLQLLPETFLILRRNEREMIKMYIGTHVKYPLFMSDFNDTCIFWANFRKIPNITFHKNPPSGSIVVPRGRTDGQDEANSRLSQFCERA
jgi:hypothetical protein